jgi:hypothetical protein
MSSRKEREAKERAASEEASREKWADHGGLLLATYCSLIYYFGTSNLTTDL